MYRIYGTAETIEQEEQLARRREYACRRRANIAGDERQCILQKATTVSYIIFKHTVTHTHMHFIAVVGVSETLI